MMRTTLTIDDDVAAKLKRLAKGGRFKEVTNRALRLGLQALERGEPDATYVTEARPGRPLVLNLDNIAEVIAQNEREDWR
jgi:hypothetical protein